MENPYESFSLGPLELANRFVFPPIKLAYGTPDGKVTERQIRFYEQIAEDGPAVLILEPVAVHPEGREHPKQLCVHLPGSESELRKIVDVIHSRDRLACLHLNHAGAAATPKVTGTSPGAPSRITCARSGAESRQLGDDDIKMIIEGFRTAAQKASGAGFDLIEIQAGHGYLVSQFMNSKINERTDSFGEDRLLFARQVLSAVWEGAGKVPFMVRLSGDEMSPEYGISREDLTPFLKLAEESGACAVHMGMGNSCFSPPWYFHHGSLPEKPQMDALGWLRSQTSLPLVVAGRMGRRKRIEKVMQEELADLIALGRPLIADPDLVGKLRDGLDEKAISCGYCLQGCLHRLVNGEPLGCNLNPEVGKPPLERTEKPLKVFVVGGGPAGMSAALYMTRRGHRVRLVEKSDRLGGQFDLAWRAPGKETMKEGLLGLRRAVEDCGAEILLNESSYRDVAAEFKPDLVVWAAGAVPKMLGTDGLDTQNLFTTLDLFTGDMKPPDPRVLVIGAGRVGLEVAEILGEQGYEVVATKRTDPIGSMMEAITRKLILKRIEQLPGVTLMPHTTVKGFHEGSVEVEQDGQKMSLEPFQTVIVTAGMLPVQEPGDEVTKGGATLEVIGDAGKVADIYSAVKAGYELALKY